MNLISKYDGRPKETSRSLWLFGRLRRFKVGRVIVAHLEQRCLGRSGLMEFVHLMNAAGFRLFLLALDPALGLISLFLLPGLLFLTLCKC